MVLRFDFEAIWPRFWTHVGSQNRPKVEIETEHGQKLISATPLQRNARFCLPKTLQNRFKIAFKRELSLHRVLKRQKSSNMYPT